MATLMTILLLVALAVALSTLPPTGGFSDPSPVDRDHERLLADLRALSGRRNP